MLLGFTGTHKKGKGRGARRAGAGEGARVRSPARALPAAPAGAWARPGRRRPRRKLPLPFPLLFSPRITGRTVWERPRSTRIFEREVGEGRAAAGAQRKTKSASVRAASARGCPREGPGRSSLCSPPKISLRHLGGGWRVAQKRTERRVRKCHDFFSCALPDTVPTPSFLVLPLPLGKGLIGFASKNCIYSVLLAEARKHAGRQDSGMKRQ